MNTKITYHVLEIDFLRNQKLLKSFDSREEAEQFSRWNAKINLSAGRSSYTEIQEVEEVEEDATNAFERLFDKLDAYHEKWERKDN